MADEDDAKVADRKSGGMVPVLALAAALVVAALAGWLGNQLLISSPDAELDAASQDQAEEGSLLERAKPIDLGSVVANVQGESGRRYVKVNVQVWVDKEDVPTVQKPELQPILRQTLQDKLRTYKMQELETGNVVDSLRRNFKEDLNKQLRTVLGTSDNPDRTYITEVVLDNFLIQ